MCYTECLGFPTAGPWLCEGNDTDGDGLSDGAEVMLFSLSPTFSDADGNGVADPIDLVYRLLAAVSADPCPSDINKDGMVTVADMLVFLTDFGVICD